MDEIRVTLPGGDELTVPAGSTVTEVAYEIGAGLGDDCLAGVVDGTLVPAEHRLTDDATVRVVTPDGDRYEDVLRWTASRVLAHAVARVRPDATLVGGGLAGSSSSWSAATVDRFYYDVADADVTGDDLDDIRDEMATVVEEDLDVDVSWVDADRAESTVGRAATRRDEPTEVRGEVPVYEQGPFTHLGAVPHLPSTGELTQFDLVDVSAVHEGETNRGGRADDEGADDSGAGSDGSTAATDGSADSGAGSDDSADVTRIWGVAFATEDDYEEYCEFQEAVEERDHVRLGRELELFDVPDSSPGCPHFYPAGQTVLNELVEYVRELDAAAGFEEVQTPELNRTDLWKTSGHYDFFFRHDDAYSWEDGDEEYGLKPTDCPNHMRLYDSQAHSYRDLPVRYVEIATIYRKHKSGETRGITRTRRYRQPDGHAFVRPDQVVDELVTYVRKFEELAATFGLDTGYTLATRSDDSIGDDARWAEATEQLRAVLDALDVEYDESPTAAFYAPEIEVELIDELGRSWKGSGYQLDYTLPERFDLTYVDEDGERRRPVVIHRGLLVSFEYLLGLLLEQFAGRLPLWLAPTQVRILPISDDNVPYAETVAESLDDLRVEVDDQSRTLSRKIRAAHEDRVPYMLVVGDDEATDGTVTVRNRDGDEARGADPSAVADLLRRERDERKPETDAVSRLS